MWAHLVDGAALAPGATPAAQPRGASKLDGGHLGMQGAGGS
jgi:hypothetical protein